MNKTYPGQDVLISYLRHRRTKSSYHGFLKLHRDAVIASLSSDLSWNELNTAWASNFIREAKKIIENQVIFEALNKKVRTECLQRKKDLQIYWQEMIKEQKENLPVVSEIIEEQKENLTAVSHPNKINETKNLSKRNNFQVEQNTDSSTSIQKKQEHKDNLFHQKKINETKDHYENSSSQVEQKEISKRIRNNDNTDSHTSLQKKRKQNELNYTQISDEAYHDLITGNIIKFIKILKKFLSTRSPMSLFSANEPVLQVIVELLLPLKHRIPELCLVMNNIKRKGKGRFGYLDIFVLGEEKNYVNIELKYISLVGLVRDINGNQLNEFSSANKLKELDEMLEKEDEEILLKRQYVHFVKETNEWKKTTIGEILNEGVKQLEAYINTVAKGQATNYSAGICDERIKVTNNSNSSKLIGYIIIVIGFRRIIWRSTDEIISNHKYSKIK